MQSDVVPQILRLKQSAKTNVTFKEFEDAHRDLDRAIEMLRNPVEAWFDPPNGEAPVTPSEDPHQLAEELSDCLGMKGGTYRRQGEMQRSLESYLDGSRYELDPKFNVSRSYNTVNALKLSLDQSTNIAEQDIPSVETAIEVIEQQVAGDRQRDGWAWSDLGDCYLILGGAESDALVAYRRFASLSDVGSIQSARNVLVALAEALQDDRATTVGHVVDMLENEFNPS